MQSSDLILLQQEFWNPYVMSRWQKILSQDELESNFYLDVDNILRDPTTGTGVAYVGGVKEKGIKGLKVTNPLRDLTSSFQYIFGLTSPIRREDGLKIGGTISELIAEPDLLLWLQLTPPSDISKDQIFSIMAQLYYATSLAAEEGYNVVPALEGIKIRRVDPNATVPFYNGSLKTYGVIPVIFDLQKITDTPGFPEAGISLVLNDVATTAHWDEDYIDFASAYEGLDLALGENWNLLTGDDIFTSASPTYSCLGRQCIGQRTGVTNANGKNGNGTTQEVTMRATYDVPYERDLWLISYAELPLPEYIVPYALAIKLQLSLAHPGDSNFVLQGKIPVNIVEEYLNLPQIQELYFRIIEENNVIDENRCKTVRPFIMSDIQEGSLSNQFFIREDFIRPQLEAGDVVTYENTVVEDYNPDTKIYTIRDIKTGKRSELEFNALLDYLSRVEGETPYQDKPISREFIANIDGQVTYLNRETGEMYPLDVNRLYVINIQEQAELLQNARTFLSLAVAYLYAQR